MRFNDTGQLIVGLPVTYEMEGPQDLLVPAAETAGVGCAAAPAVPSSAAPPWWVAYAKPAGWQGSQTNWLAAAI
jgi:hypothetical protein